MFECRDGLRPPAERAAGLVVVPGKRRSAAMDAECRGEQERRGRLVGATLRVEHDDRARALQAALHTFDRVAMRALGFAGLRRDQPAGDRAATRPCQPFFAGPTGADGRDCRKSSSVGRVVGLLGSIRSRREGVEVREREGRGRCPSRWAAADRTGSEIPESVNVSPSAKTSNPLRVSASVDRGAAPISTSSTRSRRRVAVPRARPRRALVLAPLPAEGSVGIPRPPRTTGRSTACVGGATKASVGAVRPVPRVSSMPNGGGGIRTGRCAGSSRRTSPSSDLPSAAPAVLARGDRLSASPFSSVTRRRQQAGSRV